MKMNDLLDPKNGEEIEMSRRTKIVQNPLEREFKPYKRQIDRMDIWIMLLIAAIYAIIAYVNLGSFTAPQTQTYMQSPVIIQLDRETNISDIRYYAGIGEGTIQYQYSDDGVNYQPVIDNKGEPAVIKYQNSQMYVWRSTKTDVTASYIRIDVIMPGMNINEIAVIDSDGKLAPVKSATLANDVESGFKNTDSNAADLNPQNLVDEQNIVPVNPSYMNEMYFDEIYHGRTAFEEIHHMEPYEITHPPLGKDIMTIGVNLFGMTPFGWRSVGTLFGVILLPVMYIFAKTLIRRRKYAIMATILFAVDFMHFSQTRIGTVDSYSVTFIMLMFLFMYRYTQTNFNFQPLRKTLWPLLLCGIFFGLGGATKWLCLYGGAGLAFLFFYTLYKRHREYKFAKLEPEKYPEIVKNYRKKVLFTILWCILFFIVIPGAIYVLSYMGYSHAPGNPWGLKDIIANQSYMFNYHENLNPASPHPFASEWYTWPLDIRPLLFYSNQTHPGIVSTMSTMGNPFIWLGGLIASITLLVFAINKKSRSKLAAFVGIAGLSEWAPWIFIHREKFVYHYFAVVPFLILMLVLLLKYIDENFKYGKYFTWIFVGVCIGAFVAFYPVISGTPVPAWYIPFIRWLPSWPFY